MSGRILIVDDDADMCELLVAALSARDFDVEYSLSAQDALAAVARQDFAVVVTDFAMKAMDGIEMCRRLTADRPNLPVVVITAFGSLETAVAAIRAGAYDFVTKPLDTDELALILERAIQWRSLREEVRRLRSALQKSEGFASLLGESPEMRKVTSLMARIADTDVSVLVTGETGTGKEVAARALHEASRRKEHPFVAINCAAVPEALLESELFGHVRGAYTDAKGARKGLFLQADGGTLFLDEIGSMPRPLQPKLLRVLQDRRVRPVGGDTETPVDVRIISATNRDLDAASAEGQFREDLYFRINVVHLALPPLRARGSDILLLAQHFIREFEEQMGKGVVGLSSGAAEKLLAYSWPGNVRELRNCMERAVALCQQEQITTEDLPEKIQQFEGSDVVIAGNDPSELSTLEKVERRYILHVLSATGGNKTMAAQILGLDRKTLYRKLESFGPRGESKPT